MLLSNNLKTKGSETKCTTNEQNSARGNERKYSHLIGFRLEEYVVLVEHVLVGSCCGIGSIGNQND